MMARNSARSIRDRLLNLARAEGRPFQETLQYYAMERFLYRLSVSRHRSSFVLKGALLLRAWDAPTTRATKDIDLLGRLDNSLDTVAQVLKDVCVTEVEPDGILFDAGTVDVVRIKEDAEYEGVRGRFVGFLGTARVTMQVDIGFGDVVSPVPQSIRYPVLLDQLEAELLGYPKETVIAEKFHAMTYLGTLNSRMKDFYDVWLLANQYAFEGDSLAKAISATFANRETAIDLSPAAFTPAFFGQPSTVAQWAAFRSKITGGIYPESIQEVIEVLGNFLLPVAEACVEGKRAGRLWPPGGPWGD